jgi:hypothetical protein
MMQNQSISPVRETEKEPAQINKNANQFGYKPVDFVSHFYDPLAFSSKNPSN